MEILTLSVEVEAGEVDAAEAGEDAGSLLGVVLGDAVAARRVEGYDLRRQLQIDLLVVVAVTDCHGEPGSIDLVGAGNPAVVPGVVFAIAAPHRSTDPTFFFLEEEEDGQRCKSLH